MLTVIYGFELSHMKGILVFGGEMILLWIMLLVNRKCSPSPRRTPFTNPTMRESAREAVFISLTKCICVCLSVSVQCRQKILFFS